MTTARHLSVDIETLGTTPDSIVLSIGLVTDTEQELHLFLDVDQQIDAGRKFDGNTLLWWLGQSRELADSQKNAKRIAIDQAKSHLSDFVKAHCDVKTLVWANSPSFDLVMLHNLFHGRTPWNFWQERDIRTARMIAGRTRATEAHSALDDAKVQLADAIAFYETVATLKQ
ncbi:hypothetical protein R84981_000947 [Carnimonas sp. R-84981]|uniref:3'-5' exonuclease n=1 Tax=Carnimonas bestiolae TaxID=3402172 RepID=UPI003EDBB4A3